MQVPTERQQVSEYHILSFGAGVQSTTLYLMSLLGQVPKFDAAIFADTQEEPEEVYRHLEWIKSIPGGPPLLIKSKGRIGEHLKNGTNSTGQRFVAIPAFTSSDGGATVGITRRQCSREYKTEVVSQAIRREVLGLAPRQRIAKGVIVHRYIGISLDEAGRARRIRDIFIKREHRAMHPHFPLIEKFMTRTNCLDWLARYGVPHQTPRSACVFCPYHSDYEWIMLRDSDPVGWRRAVEIDHVLRQPGSVVNRKMDAKMYLHRSCKPLDEVVFDDRPDPRKEQLAINFSQECEGMCGL